MTVTANTELTEAEKRINAVEDVTYGDIVWGQFKKNTVAYWSLWGVATLFVLAIVAPVIASARPFVWTVDAGTSYPWFSSLFDRNYYENGVDIFFNLLLVLGTPMFVGWMFWKKNLHKTIEKKRPRRRRVLLVAMSLATLLFSIFAGMLSHESLSLFPGWIILVAGFGLGAKVLPATRRVVFGLVAVALLGAAFSPILSGTIFVGAIFAIIGLTYQTRPIVIPAVALIGILLGTIFHPISQEYVVYVDVQSTLEEAGEPVESLFPVVPYSFRGTGFNPLEGPTPEHLFGIDQSTRDVGVRVLFGTRISLTIGFIAVAIYVTLGIIIGASAGFYGGKVDLIVQRVIEVVMCIPSFFLILTVIALVGKPSIFMIMATIGLVRWTGVARLIRGEFLRLRNQDFVTAAQALGFPTSRIIFQHVLPNALGPVLVSAAFGVASAILLESSLAFLGLGDLSAPSWGQTLQEGYSSGAWHLILIPGFTIFFTVLLLNLVGEGVRDAMDPKMRK
jgi:peptide/nickel transport system permease protein